MALVITDELWFCEDCTIATVNGDFSGMSEEQAAKTKKGLNDIKGVLSHTNEYREFSWHGCDCCRTGLGGALAKFVILADDGYPPLAAAGHVSTDDEGSGTYWALFSREQVKGVLAENEGDIEAIALALTGWRSSYGSAGSRFWSTPTVRITRSRVLVKQYTGLDI